MFFLFKDALGLWLFFLGRRCLILTVFASWDIRVYSKKYWLLTEIFKLQIHCDTTGLSWSWERWCQYLLVWGLTPIVFFSVDPFCLKQKIQTFSTSLTCLDSVGIFLFFNILKRQSWQALYSRYFTSSCLIKTTQKTACSETSVEGAQGTSGCGWWC